ncbi:hypothetical protein [Thalassolituus sp.]|uniref:glutamine amidotransferase-related protein n=1 Tax=Thalassolituus sp. TaxID=2030822 RepID=UPI003517EA0F
MPVLGLLETDVLYPDLLEDYRSYGHMFRTLLSGLDSHLEFRHYEVQQGELPQDLSECDAYLVTGSKTGVYDDAGWIAPLSDWIRQAFREDARLLGICFGHQILAHALGGHAEKSDKGWGVGNHMTRVEHLPVWLNDDCSHFQLIYSHQDQVQQLPPGARRLAGSEFCENASWFINDQVLTFQGHPEFTPEYFRRLLERRRECVGSELLDAAMEAISQTNDSERIGRWLLEFIHLPRT